MVLARLQRTHHTRQLPKPLGPAKTSCNPRRLAHRPPGNPDQSAPLTEPRPRPSLRLGLASSQDRTPSPGFAGGDETQRLLTAYRTSHLASLCIQVYASPPAHARRMFLPQPDCRRVGKYPHVVYPSFLLANAMVTVAIDKSFRPDRACAAATYYLHHAYEESLLIEVRSVRRGKWAYDGC